MDHAQPLAGKTAIVTGASRGIGHAVAVRLAREGARVVLCARDRAALNDVRGAIEIAEGATDALPLDLRQPDASARLAAFAGGLRARPRGKFAARSDRPSGRRRHQDALKFSIIGSYSRYAVGSGSHHYNLEGPV